MDKDKTANSGLSRSFGLVLQMDDEGEERITFITSHNTGIPAPYVILFVETWLEYFKEETKKQISDGFVSTSGKP
jgi:hypothetical protein